ncbi:MAG: hypothetical protein AB7J46_00465 [Candidatus Altimarinota bacterium]
MNIRFLLVALVAFFQISPAFAAEDFIAPTKISFQVKPGESLSYDLIYKSGIGGVYDLSTRPFQYDEAGNKLYLTDAPSLVEHAQTVYEFQAGEEKLIPIQVVIPLEIEERDVYLSHFMRRRSEEQQTFELGSLMFVRIGALPEVKGKVSNIQFKHSPNGEEVPEKGFQSIVFDFENLVERYFSITPVLQIYDAQGKELVSLENQSTFVFPEFKKAVNVFNFSGEGVAQENSHRAVLKVVAENSTVLHEEELQFPDAQTFLRQERKESPFQGINIRKGLLYHPIFQVSAIVIGLTLIAVSFFMKKQ